MSLRLFPFGLLFGLCFLASASAADTLPTDLRAKLMKPCQSMKAQDKERCEQRQLARWKLQESHNPDTALQTYDGMDLGNARLKNELQQERATENKRHWSLTRHTYREQQLTDDLNTTTRPFLNDYRAKRLACMLDAPGHRRTRCLDRLENLMREDMKITPLPPTKPYAY